MTVTVFAESLSKDLLSLLQGHIGVMLDSSRKPGRGMALEFEERGVERGIYVGQSDHPQHGLIEIMDNNPLVCAESISLPTPSATLALLCIAPLMRAGLISDEPVFQSNLPEPTDRLCPDSGVPPLEHPFAWDQVDLDTRGIAALNALVPVRPSRRSDILDLFAEAYDRSFFVRRLQDEEWDVSLAVDQPYAVLKVADESDEETIELVRVRAMSEPEGKCGAGQIVHAMNVMCGFEEHLGIA